MNDVRDGRGITRDKPIQCRGATHVGIVVNTGTRWDFVHAPADGSVVRIERFDSGYWQQRWIGARRVF